MHDESRADACKIIIQLYSVLLSIRSAKSLTLPPCEVEVVWVVVVAVVLVAVEPWLELLEPALPRCTTW